MVQIAKKEQKYVVFWAIYSDEHANKRFVFKAPIGQKPKSYLFDWIEELEKAKNVDNMALINCGVVED
jgi:hypothetical protein